MTFLFLFPDSVFFQRFFHFYRYAIAFYSLLNGFVMRPGVQPSLLYIRKKAVRLLCKPCCKIPGSHHINIVFLRSDRCDQLRILRVKILFKKMIHQDFDCKPDGISSVRGKPLMNIREQFLMVFPENLRRELITGSPIIHKRQEAADFFDTGVKILIP